MRNEKYLVFFDLEVGGLNAARHPVIQLAAVAVNAMLEPVETIEIKVQFKESQANKHSLRKNHFGRGQWAKEALPPAKAAADFGEFLRRYPGHAVISNSGEPYSVAQLVAHNAAFDGPFLQAWYARLGQFLPARYQVLCTMQRAQWHFAERPQFPPPTNFKLATLCEYFRVPFHAARAHDALGDVTATLLLYRALRLANDRECGHEATECTIMGPRK